MTSSKRLVANALLFQVAWFSCVLGANRPLLLALAVACIAIHVFWISHCRSEWRSLLLIAGCGWLVDSLLLQAGVLGFSNSTGFIPLWLALLWLAFACTLDYSLRWTAKPWWLASLLGALAGPISYYGGAHLAGVQWPLGQWPGLLILALIWALLLPALHQISGRLGVRVACEKTE